MDLIAYKVPRFDIDTVVRVKRKVKLPIGVVLYEKSKHQLPLQYVAHGEFVHGVQVYDTNCKYCVGVLKPKKTPKERAERHRIKRHHYLAWKRKQKAVHNLRLNNCT